MERVVTTTLRVPETLLEAIKAQASSNRRSFNNEVLHLIESSLKEKEHEPAAA